ncbi:MULTISPECIES: hydroxypyruvate isomerase family protein [Dyadobacter]|jgi:hydroxypyruvate isomerase|uniref:TIM barrel protein n=1 Tax=Dyadobacter chenhuakuii TaxID=2909339 RepID=A0A9X1TSX5_9BACT|nr:MULTISPECIES: TIM barrel protein [Dyadobacter]MCF2497768.1 TIM barrel protein [Dyadobacter chenhuakuii]MCF2517273.1 TIM barrel protein [Dyadobacter sp. CY351]
MSTRRSVLKSLAAGTGVLSLSDVFAANEKALGSKLNGKINHSVCKWCYGKIPLDTFAKECKEMGITSIELLGPEDWPTLKKYGLTCALPNGAGMGIEKGFNDLALHDELVKSYEDLFPKLKEAGYSTVICFSGNRRGMSDIDGMRNCAIGLRRLMPSAEKHGITMIMELLNSKVNHKDYMCDHTSWGAGLCEMVGSENFKLLYDIYHMSIMEGDVIATIKKYHKYIGHYHTGGVPGRNEIDEGQELYYPAIMKAIVDTGYKGFVAQEFIPKREPLASLKQCVQICDIA